MDFRLVKYSPAKDRCAALSLCRSCIKYAEVPCALRRLFSFLIPALMIVSLMLPSAALTVVGYRTPILGSVQDFSSPAWAQLFESRYCAWISILLLLLSWGALSFKRNEPVATAKILFAAAMGPLGFGLMRLFLRTAYRENLAWANIWEELTELIFVAGVGVVLWLFRGTLFKEEPSSTAECAQCLDSTARNRSTSVKKNFASFLRNRLVHVNLQVLYTCNYRCKICDFWKPSWEQKPSLSAAQAEVISEKLNLIGPQIVSIGGGEPMLHPELTAIVRALSHHHFPVMITNGSRVTPKLARELFAAGMVEISVSVDYADPQKHDNQRGVAGAHRRAIEALRILQASRTRPDQRVNMISVIMEDNLPEVEPLLDTCRQLGVTYLVTLHSRSRGAKPERPASADVGRQLLEIKRHHRHFVALRGYLEKFTEAVANRGIGSCHAGKNLCNIDSQGDVGLCIDRLDDPVGNILTDDVFEIEQRLLKRHETNQCQDCWTSCRGSIEALRHGRGKVSNLWDYHQMTRPVPLTGAF